MLHKAFREFREVDLHRFMVNLYYRIVQRGESDVIVCKYI